MKAKNEYLKEQGVDLEKDLDVGTYTKIRFAMEEYAKDYNESEIKKFSLGDARRSVYSYAITGTFHGSIVEAESEGEARRIFHKYYNGESIIHIRKRGNLPSGL